jgi:hypothetical protein
MQYRIYSGPPGTESIRPTERGQMLFKQFGSLDEAIGWAHHLDTIGNVALLIEGDDGTSLGRQEIAALLRHRDFERKAG